MPRARTDRSRTSRRHWRDPLTAPILVIAMAAMGLVASVLARRTRRAIVRENEELERRVAERTAELKLAKALAEEAATHDPLTTLWNHNRIIEVLDEELARSDRHGDAVSLAMLDLDHFKRVNDTYGHVVGDEVLREVAARLRGATRPYDAVGRFGGEEFLAVLPGTDAAQAARAAERIRAAIGSEPVATDAGDVRVTASVGVVTRTRGLGEDATTLLVAADTALYEAKDAGRDRVQVASFQPG